MTRVYGHVIEQWLKDKNHLSALLGLALSLLCLFVFGPKFVVPSMLAISVC